MLCITPETELAFCRYSAVLEIKETTRAALSLLTRSAPFCREAEELQPALEDITLRLKELMAAAIELAAKLRPEKTIEERGYSPVERGVLGFARAPGCGDGCGGGSCGSGGSCGGGCGGNP